MSAQQARERKKAYLSELEVRVKDLEKRNSELEERLSTLQNENQMLRQVHCLLAKIHFQRPWCMLTAYSVYHQSPKQQVRLSSVLAKLI